MAQHLIPSNATIKAIKAGDQRNRLNDGAGLYLLLFVNGGSHAWRLNYSFVGKRKPLSLDTYPLTGLSQAHKQADEARRLVREGIDPSEDRQAKRAEAVTRRELAALAEAGIAAPGIFEAVAREWFAKNEATWAGSHSEKIIRRLERDVFP